LKRLLDEVEDVDIENIIDDIASPRIGTELGRDIHYLDYFTNTSKPVKRVRKENKGGYGEKEAEKEEEDYGEEEDYEENFRDTTISVTLDGRKIESMNIEFVPQKRISEISIEIFNGLPEEITRNLDYIRFIYNGDILDNQDNMEDLELLGVEVEAEIILR
jgi:hypothetical protein